MGLDTPATFFSTYRMGSMAVLTCGILGFSSFRATLSNVPFCISPEKEDSRAGDTVDDGKRKRGQLASAH